MYNPAIDTDVPLADFPPSFEDMRQRVDAAFASLDALDVEEIEVTDDDEAAARELLQHMDKRLTKDREEVLSSPGVVVHVKAILSAYDQAVVQSAAQIRTLVTNKLLIETENADPKIRLRALELLGKISDVGLFTEKTEITLRHRPTEELEQLLRERLMKTLDMEVPTQVPKATVSLDLDILEVKPRGE